MEEGDPEEGNAAFDILVEIWAELSGRNRTDALRPLLDDENPAVRLATATRLLATMPMEAMTVLRELSASKPVTVVGLSAALALEVRRQEGFKSSSAAELVLCFRAVAATRGRAMLDNDTIAANAAGDEVDAVWRELCRRDAVDDLRSLLADDDAGVRMSAAERLWSRFRDDAERVLQNLSLQKSPIGLTAAMTLEAKDL